MSYKCEIVADSLSPQGNRLTTFKVTYPRIIHSEMMTHRMFSRNASSSRAVPVDKMIKAVRENTFCPFEFQKSHKGMQGSEYFTGAERQECINLWLESAELALQQAEKMKAKGISKQIINRILEPYQYYTVLITGSREGWDNFFSLRNPVYEYKEDVFNSKKDAIKSYTFEKGFEEDKKYLESLTDLDWLKLNKGQAEIHMMALAETIYDTMNESTPKKLEAGEWHIPFEDRLDTNLIDKELGWLDLFPDFDEIDQIPYKGDLEYENWLQNAKIKISTAMAARTSYTIVGDEKEIDYQKMIELHNRLISQNPPHSSPMEHCARAMSDEEYQNFRKGYTTTSFRGETRGWCNNYRGFINYRYLIENQ